jgi:hypothetical protein
MALLFFGTASASAQAPLRVGKVRPFRAESPHPYAVGRADRPVVWTDTVVSPGAAFLRLRFRGFALAPGDYVTVSNPDGSDFWTYTGRGPRGTGKFWSFAIEGDTAIVEIHAGPRNHHGYHIDAVGHGTAELRPPGPTPEVVCGTDGREDVACHLPEIEDVEKAVARLLFVSGLYQYYCTGWLIDGVNDSTLITNNHCLSTQTEVGTLQATFNYQSTSCGGATPAVPADFEGGTLLKTNHIDRRGKREGLDYTLLTLQGNPEADHGEIEATSDAPAVGDPIWFVQHPGGGVKKVGYYENAPPDQRLCDVHEIGQTYGRSARESQIAYACDSEGGSSGSPITNTNGLAIALHHFGRVSLSPCLNGGTAMSDICADAEQLLNCASTTQPPECGERGDPCTVNDDCCSGKCRGKQGQKTCR